MAALVIDFENVPANAATVSETVKIKG